MRAALGALLITAFGLGRPLEAQVAGASGRPPNPPTAERIQIMRYGDQIGWNDSSLSRDLKQLTDSINLIAGEMTSARMKGIPPERIGYLQGRLGALKRRLGGMQGQLGQLQGQSRALEARHGEELNEDGLRMHRMLSRRDLEQLFRHVRQDPQGIELPPADSIVRGAFAVTQGAVIGRVAATGQLDVFGTVNGNAVSLNGDVVVHKGGHVTGDALSVGGTVRLDGGTIDGELRSTDRAVAPDAAAAASSSGFLSILDQLQIAMGWLVAMVLLGFGVMVFAEDRLRVVAATIEARFGRSLFAGLLAEVSFIPVLVLSIVLLVITIIGIILLPVAIPGIFVLGALLAVLGFLAVSRVAGQALTRRAATVSVRGAELRSMLAGLFFFFGLWLVAAILSWVPVLGPLLHALAFVVTWAAVTVGLGAAVITRGGGRPAPSPVATPDAASELGWQTPTPISGIAAARRQATNTPEA